MPRDPGALRILTGQTASGKSAVAVYLGELVGAELISVDSMKLYRGLDIGTAKPSPEVRKRVVFHMIDVADPRETFSVARYVKAATAAAREAGERGRAALYVGGTPLYLRALLYGIFEGPAAQWDLRETLKARAEREGVETLYRELQARDPVTADRLHPRDLVRIIRALEVVYATGRPISQHQRQYPAPRPMVPYRMVALERTAEDLRARIAKRTEAMFAAGLVEEVRRTLRDGGFNRSAAKAIGYREVIAYLRGELSLTEAMDLVKRNTWRFARKQRTWLKSFPGVQWLMVPPDEPPEVTACRVRGWLFPDESMN